jgi:D-inositol-3-phosphate glycosyltransferase
MNVMKVALLTGGGEKHYQLGLLSGLLSVGLEVELVGNDTMAQHELVRAAHVDFYNLRGSQDPERPMAEKVIRIVRYYLKLVKYAATTKCKIFHIQWDNKFYVLDRTVLSLYYKILGKKIVVTVHNVNAGVRDRSDTILNRLSLKFLYWIADHLIVHTEKMKLQMIECYRISELKISVIPHGINTIVPRYGLSQANSRDSLLIEPTRKTLLFFGRISRDKGLDLLVDSLGFLKGRNPSFYLIIVGGVDRGSSYLAEITTQLAKRNLETDVLLRPQFVPDEEIEKYFVAADCLVLPYRLTFQSGVLFLSYSFGLPVVATNVGSFAEYIVEGETGFLAERADSRSISVAIQRYFNSELYRGMPDRRGTIRVWASKQFSWTEIGRKTREIYEMLSST